MLAITPLLKIVLMIFGIHFKYRFVQFNSIQYFNGNSTVYWHDPINIKSTSHDKRHLVIT